MTIRLVDRGWDAQFTEAIRADNAHLRIVCPFIKAGALGQLLKGRPRSIQVITRFSESDFADGVSDIEALRKLLHAGASVRGIKNLHAKLYLFGNTRAILTSANLTEAALTRNHEFGMVAQDKTVVSECHGYFDALWRKAGPELSEELLEQWDNTITRYKVTGGRPVFRPQFRDFGNDVGLDVSPSVGTPGPKAEQAFVKFLGEGHNRAPLSLTTIEEIDRAECHWSLAYPATKRPRQVRDGAVMFIARLTDDNDIRVFGRAIGMRFVEGRDDATPADIKRRWWKVQWSRYIRVYSAEFVDGTMANGVSLNELMRELGADSFISTQRHAVRGKGNTNPRNAYMRQAAVQLTPQGFAWLAERLDRAFNEFGKVKESDLARLYWPPSPSGLQDSRGKRQA